MSVISSRIMCARICTRIFRSPFRLCSSGDHPADDSKRKEKLELSHPTKKKNKENKKSDVKKFPTSQEKFHDRLKMAARDVALHLGDARQEGGTQSELLAQLERSSTAEADILGDDFLVKLLAGMKVQLVSSNLKHGNDEKNFGESGFRRDNYQRREPSLAKVSPLGIFSAAVKDLQLHHSASFYDQIEESVREEHNQLPPMDHFQEMIAWTKQGKMMDYPVNNEDGMKHEADVGFEEHVFLEHRLREFPQAGPIRVFMELVLVGLSKNPFMDVRRKHEVISWYGRFFERKGAELEDIMERAADAEQQARQAAE